MFDQFSKFNWFETSQNYLLPIRRRRGSISRSSCYFKSVLCVIHFFNNFSLDSSYGNERYPQSLFKFKCQLSTGNNFCYSAKAVGFFFTNFVICFFRFKKLFLVFYFATGTKLVSLCRRMAKRRKKTLLQEQSLILLLSIQLKTISFCYRIRGLR